MEAQDGVLENFFSCDTLDLDPELQLTARITNEIEQLLDLVPRKANDVFDDELNSPDMQGPLEGSFSILPSIIFESPGTDLLQPILKNSKIPHKIAIPINNFSIPLANEGVDFNIANSLSNISHTPFPTLSSSASLSALIDSSSRTSIEMHPLKASATATPAHLEHSMQYTLKPLKGGMFSTNAGFSYMERTSCLLRGHVARSSASLSSAINIFTEDSELEEGANVGMEQESDARVASHLSLYMRRAGKDRPQGLSAVDDSTLQLSTVLRSDSIATGDVSANVDYLSMGDPHSSNRFSRGFYYYRGRPTAMKGETGNKLHSSQHATDRSSNLPKKHRGPSSRIKMIPQDQSTCGMKFKVQSMQPTPRAAAPAVYASPAAEDDAIIEEQVDTIVSEAATTCGSMGVSLRTGVAARRGRQGELEIEDEGDQSVHSATQSVLEDGLFVDTEKDGGQSDHFEISVATEDLSADSAAAEEVTQADGGAEEQLVPNDIIPGVSPRDNKMASVGNDAASISGAGSLGSRSHPLPRLTLHKNQNVKAKLAAYYLQDESSIQQLQPGTALEDASVPNKSASKRDDVSLATEFSKYSKDYSRYSPQSSVQYEGSASDTYHSNHNNEDEDASQTSASVVSETSELPYCVHRRVMGWKLTSPQRRRELVGLLDMLSELSVGSTKGSLVGVHKIGAKLRVGESVARSNDQDLKERKAVLRAQQALVSRQAQSYSTAVSRMIKARTDQPVGKFQQMRVEKLRIEGNVPKGEGAKGSLANSLLVSRDRTGILNTKGNVRDIELFIQTAHSRVNTPAAVQMVTGDLEWDE